MLYVSAPIGKIGSSCYIARKQACFRRLLVVSMRSPEGNLGPLTLYATCPTCQTFRGTLVLFCYRSGSLLTSRSWSGACPYLRSSKEQGCFETTQPALSSALINLGLTALAVSGIMCRIYCLFRGFVTFLMQSDAGSRDMVKRLQNVIRSQRRSFVVTRAPCLLGQIVSSFSVDEHPRKSKVCSFDLVYRRGTVRVQICRQGTTLVPRLLSLTCPAVSSGRYANLSSHIYCGLGICNKTDLLPQYMEAMSTSGFNAYDACCNQARLERCLASHAADQVTNATFQT
jgi:hypothetical protein